ncbi:DNA polymerase III subunit alpha [Borreliella burgdorferi]|nr:DNA polymerase III subunit alpha [Borreliella burgdorferi]AAC66944.1 DNA polymerase III subunit alpha [Borreliella burgdorferi B31]ARS30329.1 DNA polymerase III subunit alpha [Borreliella burgdorferi]ARS31560.1 DNA polymerase III subunit alpha [Borreliella burgdorferi]ARS33307.1 DNA polymerase III subunit alpha [Borreliella burgdorferi]MCD2379016.1 DNA polymerase III subunit alpha [Borreliella burgdorferi]
MLKIKFYFDKIILGMSFRSRFIHLHVHSDYSLLDGAAKISDIISKAKKCNMSHIALTDHGNLFGAIKFYKEAKKAGIKPIIGIEAYMAKTSKFLKKQDDLGKMSYHLILLAKNELGYKNLLKLTSISYLEGFYYRPRIDKDDLEKYSEGLICTSACIGGLIPRLILANRFEDAKNEILWFKKVFGNDFYLELQRHGIKDQDIVNERLVKYSRELGVPLTAANDSHYVNREDATAQDIIVCIGTGAKKSDENRLKMETNEFYIKSQEEMCELFNDLPEALENTVRIAEKCDDFKITFPGPILPDYQIPVEFNTLGEYLEHLTLEGLKFRYKNLTSKIKDRAFYELSVIIGMGFEGYFLIVWDFIKFAHDNDIPVGAGRGSGAGSIVAYALRITDIDPLKYNLLFERFLNPERISMPDFDIDFCFEGRDEIIKYVTNKYGEDKVAQIITFGTLKPKAVVKDVARVLDIPFAESNELTKFIPDGPKVSLKEVLDDNSLKECFTSKPVYKELMNAALVLEGMNRHASTHAAGIVISKTPLTDYVPLYKDYKQGSVSTQYTMDLLEECGLVKMDFLGLKTLTLIKNAENLIRSVNPDFKIKNIPDNDVKTFNMLGEGRSASVFQFESEGMQQILKDAKPDSIEDLIALNALYRPGPMQFIPQFIAAKKGVKRIKYPHPDLKEVLRPTYGVIVYQEQVMEVAKIIGGFSLGKADILRRAMGKKKEDEMNEMKVDFLRGAIEKGYDKEIASEIFELLKPFSGYGFNKSHAAAYSLIAYQTAYLKANYPEYFMAANLTNEINNNDKLSYYIEESKAIGINVLKPDINRSFREFRVTDSGISYGLNGIKNLGGIVVDLIIDEREKNGKYSSFEDFIRRVDDKVINKKFLESAIKSGLFDSLDQNRKTLFENLDHLIEVVSEDKNNKKLGQNSLFGALESQDPIQQSFNYQTFKEYSYSELLGFEKELLGFYVSGHPLDPYKKAIDSFSSLNVLTDLAAKKDSIVQFSGILNSVKVIQTKRNNAKMAFGVIEDFKGAIDIVVFTESYERYRNFLLEGNVIGVVGRLTFNRDKFSIVVEKVVNIERLSEYKINNIHIKFLNNKLNDLQLLNSLKESISNFEDNSGFSNVYFYLRENGKDLKLKMNSILNFVPDEDKLDKLRKCVIVEDVWVD